MLGGRHIGDKLAHLRFKPTFTGNERNSRTSIYNSDKTQTLTIFIWNGCIESRYGLKPWEILTL